MGCPALVGLHTRYGPYYRYTFCRSTTIAPGYCKFVSPTDQHSSHKLGSTFDTACTDLLVDMTKMDTLSTVDKILVEPGRNRKLDNTFRVEVVECNPFLGFYITNLRYNIMIVLVPKECLTCQT